MTVPDATPIVIAPLRDPRDAAAFRTLNQHWISEFFRLEPGDIHVLADPAKTVVDRGGEVLMAHAGDRIVGCVALAPLGHGRYELAKMAVAPEQRRRGTGRALVLAALQEARGREARLVYLTSARRLEAAISLYLAFGFVEVQPAELGLPANPYARADISMVLHLRE